MYNNNYGNGNNYQKQNYGNQQQNQGQKKNASVGALWVRQSRNGGQFFSISIDGVGNFLAFPNNYKNADNQPDFRLIPSEQQNKPQQTPMRKQNFKQYNNAGVEENNNYQKQNYGNQQQTTYPQQKPTQQNNFTQEQMPQNMQQQQVDNNYQQANDEEFQNLNLF